MAKKPSSKNQHLNNAPGEGGKARSKPRLNDAALPDHTHRKKTRVATRPTIQTGGKKSAKDLVDHQGLPFQNLGKLVSNFDTNAIHEDPSHPDSPSVADRINKNRESVSSVLVSMIIHTTLLIVLAVITLNWADNDNSIGILAKIDSTPEVDDTRFDMNSIDVSPTMPDETSPLEQIADDTANANEEQTPQLDQQATFDSPENLTPLPVVTNAQSTGTVQVNPKGGGLEGRNAESRARLASERGGTEASEQAVELGIQWIIEHQQSNGSWRFFHHRGACDGRCANQGTKESSSAATGLALLSILGAGYSHHAGPYQTQVQKGLDFLRGRMRKTSFGGSFVEDTMYDQGIVTLALSEAYIMTKDETLREPVELAMKYIVAAQHSTGGWRYRAGEAPGDITVTGWQLMALKSCQRAGFHPPLRTISLAEAFVLNLTDDEYTFGYMKRTDGTQATSAIGMLCRLYLGAQRNSGTFAMAAENLISQGPSRTDIYYNYYATLDLHHLNSQHWDLWNQQMREYLVKTQDRRGHQLGSWYFPDKHGKVGGRLYTTAMAIMILEVYYRYMPLYDEKTVLNKFVR